MSARSAAASAATASRRRFVQRAQGRLHHRPVCRLPRSVRELGRRHRGRLVLQEQRDLVEPGVLDGDRGYHSSGGSASQLCCEPTSSPAPSSRSRTPRSAPAWACSSRRGACCTSRAVSRSEKSAGRSRIPEASTSARSVAPRHPRLASCADLASVATATTAVTWSDTRVGSTVGAVGKPRSRPAGRSGPSTATPTSATTPRPSA